MMAEIDDKPFGCRKVLGVGLRLACKRANPNNKFYFYLGTEYYKIKCTVLIGK